MRRVCPKNRHLTACDVSGSEAFVARDFGLSALNFRFLVLVAIAKEHQAGDRCFPKNCGHPYLGQGGGQLTVSHAYDLRRKETEHRRYQSTLYNSMKC